MIESGTGDDTASIMSELLEPLGLEMRYKGFDDVHYAFKVSEMKLIPTTKGTK